MNCRHQEASRARKEKCVVMVQRSMFFAGAGFYAYVIFYFQKKKKNNLFPLDLSRMSFLSLYM